MTTVRLTEDIAVDFGPGEEMVGIEILDASEHQGFSKDDLKMELENVMVG
ncbi:MAG: DUF2283 domain-containing protein [Chloroflexi bacterium]|nr:DUF2283 domain-containing protein [Chloroflexota bacterium]